MDHHLIEVWVDVGGTFTDCFVSQPSDKTEANKASSTKRDAIKVLSSGLVAAHAASVISNQDLLVELPSRLVAPGFWAGATLMDDEDQVLGIVDQCVIESAADESSCVKLTLKTGELTGVQIGDRLTLNGQIEAPVLATRLLLKIPLLDPLPPLQVRIGTTRGTNALLTRSGASTALLITEGFVDLLAIGTQDRPKLFELDIVKPEPLARHVIEVRGRLDSDGQELIPLDEVGLREKLTSLRGGPDCPETLAICLLHSHRNDVHEKAVQRIAKECGFQRVVRSTAVAPLPRIVPRAETTTLDAYLQPVLEDYVHRVGKQFGGDQCHLRWMTSGGNLVTSSAFLGRDSVLSGPAGGVVALAEVARRVSAVGAVGLDMGGTSTDVSRLEGEVGRRQESNIGGVRVLAPMMDIHTVAAGGGSICRVQDGRLFVGPESAGADPGPACYGRGGPLTITDVNVLLGRLPVDRFPFPLDVQASERALQLAHELLPETSKLSKTELAEGFLQIAITEMAEAVRVVTTSAGSDVRKLVLVGFGGAAGGHVCRVAEALEMSRIVDHPDAGLLSAVGIGHAPTGRIVTRALELEISDSCDSSKVREQSASSMERISNVVNEAKEECLEQLQRDERIDASEVDVRFEVDTRYAGTQSTLAVELLPTQSLAERFDRKHHETFGYLRPTMAIETVAVRCEATVPHHQGSNACSKVFQSVEVDQRESSRRLDRDQLRAGQQITGPAIVSGEHSVLVVEAGWVAEVEPDGLIQLRSERKKSVDFRSAKDRTNADQSNTNDLIEMEVAARRVQGIAEAMGEVIRRTSVSVNVKERRDYSCAVFLGDGSLVANAPHVPVHLGAMGHTVRSLIASYPVMNPGDACLSNDPFSGGSHLPDVTVVTPVFVDGTTSTRPKDWPCDFFVASRCHHAEIGGIVPGSMAPAATCLAEEGVLIRNQPLVRGGQSHHDDLRRLLGTSPLPSRRVDENMADIAAAEAAGREGARAVMDLASSLPPGRLAELLKHLLHVAGEATSSWIGSLGDKQRSFQDQLDDGTPVCVTLTPRPSEGRLRIDFTGTGGVHSNGFNATPSIVTAAVLYVLRCVSPSELPLCDGVLRRVDLIIPSGLLNPPSSDDPRLCPAVVAGNVETSNRVVDVLLGALDAAAASQGTMNNLLLGDDTFGYYETIGGGAGATANAGGADAVHTHMTNTRITDPEILESRLPVRLWRFAIRRGSGGQGRNRGGNGMIREMEFLSPLTLSLITSRRTTSPYGLRGGNSGQSGRQTLIRDGIETRLAHAVTLEVFAGDRLRIETPGGGGFGEMD